MISPADPSPRERPLDAALRDRRAAFRLVDLPAAPARRAAVYSRFVLLMKVVLPSVAALLVAAIVVWPELQPTDSRFRIGFAALASRDRESLSMVNPRYVGIDDKRQPYTITADMARNAPKDVTIVELDVPKADIALRDGSWLVVTAETGSFNRTAKTLALDGAVNVFHDGGYEIRTARADVDLERGVAAGDRPVEGQGPFGELRAEGFVMREKGNVILFTGRARLVLYPEPGWSER